MMIRPKMVLHLLAVSSLVVAGSASVGSSSVHSANAVPAHVAINCSKGVAICTEVADSESTFGEGHYVGHDEPSLLFYSNQHGSGNQMQYSMTLPTDPPPTNPRTNSYNFQLHPAFWFGMAMCDTQSAPHPLANMACTPDSDKNITTDANIANHPGTAFMEMQFYPPGWVKNIAGTSCDATKWCAALNIDSLSEDYPSGQLNNDTCLGVTGVEPVNFAYITPNGVPQAPPNPVDSTGATFTPDTSKDLLMNSGDKIVTTMADTAHGLRIDISDLTSGQHGFMVASAANGFGQVKFAPNPSTDCTNIPSDFHPMYDTSSTMTRVPWTAHSYNVAFSDEIGHFDFCNGTINPTGFQQCQSGTEGDGEPTEGVVLDSDGNPLPSADDWSCFPASASLLVRVPGCDASNSGFDGTSYLPDWPDGNGHHPTPISFSSPHFGPNYNHRYEAVGFETDLPRVEAADSTAAAAPCDRNTGANCTLIPITDDNVPAAFYPFYSTAGADRGCVWNIGNNIPGVTTDNFGGNAQYGSLLLLTYPAFGGNGATTTRYNDFRGVTHNSCEGAH
jgi:hypothetical protein